MSLFEDFVNTELPRRPVMFVYEITGYDGNPNVTPPAPTYFQLAPPGSLFLQKTGGVLWKKESFAAGTWTVTGGSGSGIQFVTTAERLLLAGTDKKVVFDTDLNKILAFDGSAWAEV